MYDKLTGKERSEKVKQLGASLTSQQQYFASAREPNESTTKASYEVAMLIAKHSKPFTEGEFIKSCMMTILKSAWHVTLWHIELRNCLQISKDNWESE